MKGNGKVAALLALLLLGWGGIQLVVATERRTSERDPRDERADPKASVASGSGAVAEGAAGEARAAVGPEAEAALPAAAAQAQASVPGVLSLQLEDPAHQPLEGIRLLVTFDDEQGGRELSFVDLNQGDDGTSVVTNFLGRANAFVPAGRAGTLHAWSDAGGLEPRAVAFSALAPFEDRSLLVVLRRGPDAALERTVVDGESGRALAGALVRVREETHSIGGTTTDEAGVFRATWDSWREVHLRIEAQGYSSTLVPLAGEEPPQPIPLWRTAALELRATTATGLPLKDIRVDVDGLLAEALPVRLRTPDLLAEHLDPRGTRHTLPRSTTTNARGLARIDLLPSRVPLTLDLRWTPSGQSRLHVAPLEPGELRAIEWSPLGPEDGASLGGRLVDQDERPVAGQEIWLVDPVRDEPLSFLDSALAREGYLVCGQLDAWTTTESDGSFRLVNVVPGRYRIGPSPACVDSWHASENANAVAPWGSLIEIVEGEEPPAVLLQRPRELWVRCTVVDSHGSVRPALVVAEHGASSLQAGFLGEPLLLGPLLDDVHRIHAFDSESGARSAIKKARPVRGGGELLELELFAAGESESLASLSGLVIDAESGAGLIGEVHAIAAERAAAAMDPGKWHATYNGTSARWREWQSALCDGMGRFTIEGLEPGVYVLLAEAGAAVGLARAIVPGSGDRVREVQIRVPRATSLVVTKAERFYGSWAARLEGIVVARGEWKRDEPFLVPGGRLELEILSDELEYFQSVGILADGTSYFTIDAPPGSSLELELAGEER